MDVDVRGSSVKLNHSLTHHRWPSTENARKDNRRQSIGPVPVLPDSVCITRTGGFVTAFNLDI